MPGVSRAAGGGAAAGRPPVLLTAADATRIVGTVDASDVSGRFSVEVPAGDAMTTLSTARHVWAWDTGYTVADCLGQVPGMILDNLSHPAGSAARLVWCFGLAFRADTSINFATDKSCWAAIQIGRASDPNTRKKHNAYNDNAGIGSGNTYENWERGDLKVPLMPAGVHRKTWLLHSRGNSTGLERIGQSDATLTGTDKVIAWAALDLCGTVASAQTLAGALYFVPPAGDYAGV